MLQLGPIGGLEKTIPIGLGSIIGGDSHDDHLATVVCRIREHDQPVVRLLGGLHGRAQPDHRDKYFTEEEHARNDQFTPCCSRAKSNTLVLDL